MPGILLENSALKKKERKKERFSTEYDQYGNWLSYDNNLGFPGSSTGKGSACNTGDSSLIQRSGEGIGYPLQYSWASLVAQYGKESTCKTKKESTCNVGGLGSIPGSGRSSGGGHSNLLQYSCLENCMDRGARQTKIQGVTKSWTQLSN